MKPQDFLVGIRDFFSIVVPGALLLFLLRELMPQYIKLGETGFDLFTFAVAAYLVGSAALGLGSVLDWAVDIILDSEKFRARFGRRLAAREHLAEKLRLDVLRNCPTPFHEDADTREPTKVFWRNYLRLNSPSAIAELDRLEALQKMYRTLVAVFVILLIFDVVRQLKFDLVNGLRNTIRPSSLVANAMACNLTGIAASWVGLALVALGYYAVGRWRYLGAVYSLAAAFCVQKCGR